jgi:PAS domain-containing protein
MSILKTVMPEEFMNNFPGLLWIKNLNLEYEFFNDRFCKLFGFKSTHDYLHKNDVLNCLARGNTAKSTAAILNMAPRTVQQHVENIKKKMNVS